MKKKMSEQERKALQAKLSDLEELYAAGYRYAARNQSGELRAYKRHLTKKSISGSAMVMVQGMLSRFDMTCSIC